GGELCARSGNGRALGGELRARSGNRSARGGNLRARSSNTSALDRNTRARYSNTSAPGVLRGRSLPDRYRRTCGRGFADGGLSGAGAGADLAIAAALGRSRIVRRNAPFSGAL